MFAAIEFSSKGRGVGTADGSPAPLFPQILAEGSAKTGVMEYSEINVTSANAKSERRNESTPLFIWNTPLKFV
jgi:hypothetical protein